MPASDLGACGNRLPPGFPETTGRTDFPGPVVTHRFPGPVAPGPEAARTRMGESADALEEP
jgi:hypothetical protein